MKFDWSGEAFSGLGTRADAMGGSISTLYPSADLISSNPAGLGFARGFEITLDWAPPLKIDPGGLLGIEDRINDGLVEAALNNQLPVDPVTRAVLIDSVVVDAIVSTELNMSGGLKGGAIMYGTPHFTVAASFHEPFNLQSQFNISGVELLAAALDDDGKETHRIFATVNGNTNFALNLESSSLAIATERIPKLPNLSIGLAYDSFGGEFNFESTFLPEGIISSSGGDTRFFNDPARIQYDSLYVTSRANWEGSGDRFRLGLGYHPSPHFSLDAVLIEPAKIGMSGPFAMVYNKIRAVNLNPDCTVGEETFDVDVLVEDNLTKTEKVVMRVPGVTFRSPGSAILGFSSKWGANYVFSLVYTKYFDELSYDMSFTQLDSVGERMKTGNIRQGMELGSAYKLGIGVEPIMVGLGLITAETFRATDTQDFEDGVPSDSDSHRSRSSLFIPTFSLGGSVNFGSHFRLDYIASFFNSSFFRFSTSYAFR